MVDGRDALRRVLLSPSASARGIVGRAGAHPYLVYYPAGGGCLGGFHACMSDLGRHLPAQGVYLTPDGPTICFLTVCTKDRRPWLACREVQESLTDLWSGEARAWLTGRYLLMPDHLHLFCAWADEQFGIETWMQFWKSRFSKRLPEHPSWEWQRGGFHHRLRTVEAYQEKWAYVRDNPVRAGLVAAPDDWPWQGTVHELPWYEV